jgi:hypothetical protein
MRERPRRRSRRRDGRACGQPKRSKPPLDVAHQRLFAAEQMRDAGNV